MKDPILLRTIPCQQIGRLIASAALGLLASHTSATTLDAAFNSPSDVPVTADSYTAAGNTISFTLNFAPTVGMDLLVVKDPGLDFIKRGLR